MKSVLQIKIKKKCFEDENRVERKSLEVIYALEMVNLGGILENIGYTEMNGNCQIHQAVFYEFCRSGFQFLDLISYQRNE